MENKNLKPQTGKVDWMITLVPLFIVIALCLLFFLMPEQSNAVINNIRFFLGDTMGSYYLVIGLGIFLISMFFALSKFGNIVLGKQDEKPKYRLGLHDVHRRSCGRYSVLFFF